MLLLLLLLTAGALGGDRSYSIYGVHFLLGAVLVTELDVIVQVVVDECDCVVDAHRLWELAVGLEISRLVRGVLEDDVRFRVLVVTQTDEDDVALVDPDLFSKFASDVTQSLDTVEAHRLQPAIAEHFRDLCVFLFVFLEDQLTLFRLVFVLTATTVLSSLSFILRHGGFRCCSV